MQLTRAQQQFINWLKRYDAPLYQVTMEKMRISDSLGAVEEPVKKGFFDSFTENLTKGLNAVTGAISQVLPTYNKLQTSRAEIDYQIKRAKQGLPPSPQQPPANPTPAPPESKPLIQRIAVASWNNAGAMSKLAPLVVPLGAAAIIWIVTTKKKGR